MQHVIEMVRFKLVAGATREDFLASNAHLNQWVRQQPGFVSRQLVQDEDAQFVDIVEWQSRAQALAAAEKFNSEMADSACMAMIDLQSIQMQHGDQLLRV